MRYMVLGVVDAKFSRNHCCKVVLKTKICCKVGVLSLLLMMHKLVWVHDYRESKFSVDGNFSYNFMKLIYAGDGIH